MKEILVWYQRGRLTGSLHLSVLHNSIAYTIAEWESRNLDTIITHYLKDNVVVKI